MDILTSTKKIKFIKETQIYQSKTSQLMEMFWVMRF